jgi:DNA-binding winged helix-turn-helix (wHTH) protein
MEAFAVGDVFLFDGFRLDRRGGGLFRRDERGDFVLIATSSRALDVLGVLVERSGDLVSRDAIMTAVWPATVVEEANLNMQIAALRRVLDDGRADASCIQTVPGRGYRFVAKVTRGAADAGGVPWLRRLSIVVLPFTNLSNDPGQQYFADSITDDVTTDLSRLAHMFVISRNTRSPIEITQSPLSESAENRGPLRARRQCPPGRQPGPRQHPADRRRI